jgi:uncharacterized repeat protein (TIGR01451 family)
MPSILHCSEIKVIDMKKQFYLAGLGTIAAFSIIPINGSPLLATAMVAGTTLAENVINQPKVVLQLTAEKQLIQKDAESKEQFIWQTLTANKAVVQPGDVVRYTVTGENKGTRFAKNLTVTQPIPKGTIFVLNSATSAYKNYSAITYSIDNGKTFVAKPTVKVTLPNTQVEEHPAPAAAYTHIRWNFGNILEPNTAIKAGYQVQVRL